MHMVKAGQIKSSKLQTVAESGLAKASESYCSREEENNKFSLDV